MTQFDDDIQTISKLIDSTAIAIVTTQTADGELHSRPLGVQGEFDGDLWFFTPDPSEKSDDVAAHPKVNVAFESGKGYLSIAGTASIVRDQAKIDELWSKSVEAWFPEGRDDPSLALLKVEAETAEYWTMDDPAPVRLIKIARAALGGGTPDVGENRSVEL